MRPVLKAGLLPVWRNRDTVQIGVDPRRAIALTGMRDAAGLLGLLDGSRDRSQVLAAAQGLGIPPRTADRVLGLLAAGGVLDDFPAAAYRAIPASARARLAPELATAALAHGDSDGGARTMARRRQACVHVRGTGRVGLQVAALLAGAGVGRVSCSGAADGAAAEPEGGPGCWPPASPRPDLVILADSRRREIAEALVRELIPHLSACGSEAIGVVGPLVVPGRSACLRCLDMARSDQDPAWPLILAQLAGAAAEPPACDTVLAAAVAAQAAAQALNFIDRDWASTCVANGTLDLVLPGWQWRRRTWQPHPGCGCGSRGAS